MSVGRLLSVVNLTSTERRLPAADLVSLPLVRMPLSGAMLALPLIALGGKEMRWCAIERGSAAGSWESADDNARSRAAEGSESDRSPFSSRRMSLGKPSAVC